MLEMMFLSGATLKRILLARQAEQVPVLGLSLL